MTKSSGLSGWNRLRSTVEGVASGLREVADGQMVEAFLALLFGQGSLLARGNTELVAAIARACADRVGAELREIGPPPRRRSRPARSTTILTRYDDHVETRRGWAQDLGSRSHCIGVAHNVEEWSAVADPVTIDSWMRAQNGAGYLMVVATTESANTDFSASWGGVSIASLNPPQPLSRVPPARVSIDEVHLVRAALHAMPRPSPSVEAAFTLAADVFREGFDVTIRVAALHALRQGRDEIAVADIIYALPLTLDHRVGETRRRELQHQLAEI